MIDQRKRAPDMLEHNEIHTEQISFIERHNINPLIFAFVSLVIIFLLYQVGGGVLMFVVVGTAAITHENVWTIRWLTMIGQICFILIPTLFFAKLFTPRFPLIFRFRIPGLRESTFALIALFSLQRVFEAYLFFQEKFPLPQLLQDVIEPIKKMFEELLKVLVHAASPEELVFVIIVVAIYPQLLKRCYFVDLSKKHSNS